MLKKLLILPLVGGLMSITAFASANDYTFSAGSSDSSNVSPSTITFNEDTTLYVKSYTANSFGDWGSSEYVHFSCSDYDICEDYIYDFGYNSDYCSDTDGLGIYISNSNYYSNQVCGLNNSSFVIKAGTYSVSNDASNNGILVLSDTPIVPDTPEDSDTSFVPNIPASFTSGLTSLVNNFGGTIANWLPTIILVALGITAIFSLFRVVRNYARSSFRG